MAHDFTKLSQQVIAIQSNRDNLIEQGARDETAYAEIVALVHADDSIENILAAVAPKVDAFMQKYLPDAESQLGTFALNPPARRLKSDEPRGIPTPKNDAPQPINRKTLEEKIYEHLKDVFPKDKK